MVEKGGPMSTTNVNRTFPVSYQDIITDSITISGGNGESEFNGGGFVGGSGNSVDSSDNAVAADYVDTYDYIFENDAALSQQITLTNKRGQLIRCFGQLGKGDIVKIYNTVQYKDAKVTSLNIKKQTAVIKCKNVTNPNKYLSIKISFKKGVGWIFNNPITVDFNKLFCVFTYTDTLGSCITTSNVTNASFTTLALQ